MPVSADPAWNPRRDGRPDVWPRPGLAPRLYPSHPPSWTFSAAAALAVGSYRLSPAWRRPLRIPRCAACFPSSFRGAPHHPRHSGARAARTRNPLGRNDRGWMDSGFAPLRFAPRNDGGGLSPSLRANGSRECAPDDRLREATHVTARGDMDCFVASLLAMTAVRI